MVNGYVVKRDTCSLQVLFDSGYFNLIPGVPGWIVWGQDDREKVPEFGLG